MKLHLRRDSRTRRRNNLRRLVAGVVRLSLAFDPLSFTLDAAAPILHLQGIVSGTITVDGNPTTVTILGRREHHLQRNDGAASWARDEQCDDRFVDLGHRGNAVVWNKVEAEAEAADARWGLLQGRLFGGDIDRFRGIQQAFHEQVLSQSHW